MEQDAKIWEQNLKKYSFAYSRKFADLLAEYYKEYGATYREHFGKSMS